MTTNQSIDNTYAAKLEAARRGHHAIGKPRCGCGFRADSWAELDEHILSSAIHERKAEQ